jgi:hyperosmotically inducible periplasmic protein
MIKIQKIISLHIVFAVLALFIFSVQASESSKPENMASDSAITASIKSKYALDKDVSAIDIKVSTVNGKVHLKGKIADKETGKKAVEIARHTKGVKEVKYELEDTRMSPSESSTAGHLVSDVAITAAIKSKYALDQKISALNIHITTINGRVYLKGKIADVEAGKHAIDIAQNTDGVKEVTYQFDLQDY